MFHPNGSSSPLARVSVVCALQILAILAQVFRRPTPGAAHRQRNQADLAMTKLAIFLGLAALAGAKELTQATWDAETAGKTVFVKFLAPW